MLPLEHSAILLTCIKRQLVFFFEWPFQTGFTVYTNMHTSVCVSVYVKYTTQMSTVVSLICLGPSFQKMTRQFLLHGSLRPTNLEKNLKPCNFVHKYLLSGHLCHIASLQPSFFMPKTINMQHCFIQTT